MRARSAIAAGFAVLCLATGSVRAHDGTFLDIYTRTLQNCRSCHVPEKPGVDGGLAPETSEDGWRNSLVDVAPANETALAAGKLRVHEFIPWNSSLIDKLTGDVKTGEGGAMRSSTFPDLGAGAEGPAEIEGCPGLVDEVWNWILAGAPAQGFAAGDAHPFNVDCGARDQPVMPAVPAPVPGLQRTSQTVTVSAPAREAWGTTEVSLDNDAEILVDWIEVVADAGTEYVAVRRKDDVAPLIVARGQIDRMVPANWPPTGEPDRIVRATLALPAGVAIALAPDETLVIEQRIRNDFWLRPGAAGNPSSKLYFNHSRGRAIVNLHEVADPNTIEHRAEPFLDTTGTEALLVPPRSIGATAGIWSPAPAALNGAVVGLWTDQRVVTAVVSDPAGSPIQLDEDVTRHYVTVGTGEAPLEAIAYACAHSNGLTDNLSGDLRSAQPAITKIEGVVVIASRPQRWGCQTEADPLALPPGLPGAPSEACYRSNDDQDDCAGIGTETCVPANLVGGDGVEDGRCSLTGVAW